MCNAWDKYKSRVPSIMLGTGIILTYTTRIHTVFYHPYVGQV